MLCSCIGMCCVLSYLHNVSCTINTQGRKHRRQFCKVLTTVWRLLVQITSCLWSGTTHSCVWLPANSIKCSHLCLLATNSLSSTGDASCNRLFACSPSNLQTDTQLTRIWPCCLRCLHVVNTLHHLSERNFSRVNLAEGSRSCVGVGKL